MYCLDRIKWCELQWAVRRTWFHHYNSPGGLPAGFNKQPGLLLRLCVAGLFFGTAEIKEKFSSDDYQVGHLDGIRSFGVEAAFYPFALWRESAAICCVT